MAEISVAPFIFNPSEPLAKFLLPVSMTLSSTGLHILVSEKEILPPGSTTKIPLNCKLIMPPGYLGLFMSLNQQTNKGVAVFSGVFDPDFQEKIELLLYNESKEKYVWNTGDFFAALIVLQSSMIKKTTTQSRQEYE